MPVKFVQIFDKVEITLDASHIELPIVTQWTHLIKKISFYMCTTKIKLYRALIKSRKMFQMYKLFSTF